MAIDAPAINEAIVVSRIEHPKVHLGYLDGLRGMAALYVVLYHASAPTWAGGPVARVLLLLQKPLIYGHYAVAVFIVLSGYCLMIPVAKSAERRLRDGIKGYLARRAWRILPTYYAALLLSLVLIYLVPDLHTRNGSYWDGAVPAFSPGVLISHIFLVHNFADAWNIRIDPPMWTVATEWQIYFIFPLLLLLWRRFGLVVTLAAGMVLGYAPHFLMPHTLNFDVAAPWYIGLFAFGMCASAINFSALVSPAALYKRLPWGKMTLALCAAMAVPALFAARWWWANPWFGDLQAGLAAASLLIYCTNTLQMRTGSGKSLILRALEAPWIIRIGGFSYSLYLIHFPLLALIHVPLMRLSISPSMRSILMTVCGVPLVSVGAYLFYLAFERTALNARERRSLPLRLEKQVMVGKTT